MTWNVFARVRVLQVLARERVSPTTWVLFSSFFFPHLDGKITQDWTQLQCSNGNNALGISTWGGIFWIAFKWHLSSLHPSLMMKITNKVPLHSQITEDVSIPYYFWGNWIIIPENLFLMHSDYRIGFRCRSFRLSCKKCHEHEKKKVNTSKKRKKT